MANEVLHRECLNTGNRKVFTWSSWIKCDKFTGPVRLWSHYFDGGSAQSAIQFGYRNGDSQEGAIRVFNVVSGGSMSGLFELDTLLRDYSGWFHLLVSVNTTLSNADDRIKIYINGVSQQPFAATYSAPAVNEEYSWNSQYSFNGNRGHIIGSYDSGSGGERWEGQLTDIFWVDGQALTPEVFGFYKDGNGYISAGSEQATDFRNGQWVPRTPREIKNLINDNGGFGVNGFYLPMNDSSNFGADFHCEPNSIIKLKGENLPQPRNGAPETTDAYVSQLREDPYAANLVLAVPGISGGQGSGYGDYSADIKGSGTNKTLTANGNAGIAAIPSYYGSALSFNYASNDYISMSALPAFGTGDWTIEEWVKIPSGTPMQTYWRASLGLNGDSNTSNSLTIYHTADADAGAAIAGGVSFIGGTNSYRLYSKEDIRDDCWHHIAVEKYNNVVTLYVDGVAKDLSSDTINYSATGDTYIGVSRLISTNYFNGQIKDVRVYQGVAKYKGGFDVPKPYTPVGISTWRAVPDTTANNFAIMNRLAAYPLKRNTGAYVPTEVQFANGNLDVRNAGNGGFAPLQQAHSNFGMDSGKWYWECSNFASASNERLGISLGAEQIFTQTGSGGAIETPILLGGADGQLIVGGNYNSAIGDYEYLATATFDNTNAATWGNNDIIGFAFDRDNMSLTVYKNGVQTVSATNIVSQSKVSTWFATKSGAGSANPSGQSYNFGQNPTFCGTLGNIASARVNSTNASWDQSTNTGTHVDWTVSSDGRSLDVAVPSGNYARARLTIDPDKKYLFSFRYNTGPANLGIQNENGYLTANDGSISPSGLSSGNTYTFEISNSSEIIVTGFTGSSYGLSSVLVTENVPAPYSDENGKGEFRYQPPTGFLALCEDNLPTPTIKDPGEHFKTVLYRGDNISNGVGQRAVSGVGFKPDLVWIKCRNYPQWHVIYDSVRGLSALNSNTTAAEAYGTQLLGGYNEDGFTTSANNDSNYNLGDFTAWCWKAGGPAVTNTDGTIASQVSANQTAGFSIVKATMVSGVKTIGHGLAKTPKFIIAKQTNGTTGWYCYHSVLGATKNIRFDLTSVESTNTAIWGDTEPTSSVFTMGTGFGSSESYIAYCWAEIEGFSKFGSYQGNSNADGPFVYCGFKPAWVLVRRVLGENWAIIDSSRNPTNVATNFLRADESAIETTAAANMDLLSNGFKLRGTDTKSNASAGTYIFAAFAESPFKYANSK